LEKETRALMTVVVFFMLSLIGAWVLFSTLESYAEMWSPPYRLGGAVAGFFIIFLVLFMTYSKLTAKPVSTLMKEASRAISKPKGFREYRSSEKGFMIYYPEEWKMVEDLTFPPVSFVKEDGSNLRIISQKADKRFLNALKEDPKQFSDLLLRFYGVMFKDLTILEKRTTAIHGMQCPMYIMEQKIEGESLRYVQIGYIDVKRGTLHWINWTTAAAKYEDLKPLFEKIVSTFQTI